MRHRISGRKLNRTSSHRQAMLRNLALALLERERIRTTLPKARELRRFVEPLITRARTDSVANRRWVRARLANSTILNRLFVEVAPAFADRPGGYTRIVKCGYRVGDSAPMAYIALVDDPISSIAAPEGDDSENLPTVGLPESPAGAGKS